MYCSRSCNEQARQARRSAETSRRAEACEQCGANLEHKQKRARFCSTKCGQDWRNAQAASITLAAKRGRACRGCGGEIPAGRFANSLYCSEPCKSRSRRHEAYGLTRAELATLLAQHEVCAICQSSNWGKKGPQVDHCHETGRIRGVLCINCNNGLGRFNDDPARIEAAAAYLRR